MNQDDVDRALFAHGHSHHRLKFSASIVSRAGTRIDESLDVDGIIVSDPTLAIGDLVRDREVVVRLPLGRNSGIDGDALAAKAFHQQLSPNRLAISAPNQRSISAASSTIDDHESSRRLMTRGFLSRHVPDMDGEILSSLRDGFFLAMNKAVPMFAGKNLQG
ncbi:hypothetical protein MU848_06795 [Sphingobium sp. MAH-33]|uniref:Uncharacterized protein n=1 Tax=Sphingobium agri TaxID=2933566 RepID=A0ABT0DW55_9SPHN|nr:hypothetical protein [Sphingobium agri]MCK0531289.1 hypothetical protein [Sphingobium agri]